MSAEQVVRDFLAAWPRRDIEELISFFSAEAVYHNVPVAPLRGAPAIRAAFEGFLASMPEIRLDLVSLAGSGDVVLTERVDRFLLPSGKRFDLPVAGIFELRGGKIVRFSDYFDLASFEGPSGLKL
jgi:limonene-1,2-epoxide hydrolase